MASSHPLDADDIAHACGCRIEWVVQLTEAGIVQPPAVDQPPADWRFGSADLRLALEARRLERDFDVNLDAAALILDLSREVRRLKALLHAQNIQDREQT